MAKCCNELKKMKSDFNNLVSYSLNNSSEADCCKSLKKIRKYFNIILIEIGNDNLQNRKKTTRKSQRNKKQPNKLIQTM